MEEQLLDDYKRNAIFRLEESLRMIKIAMEYTDDVLLWKTPFPNGMTLGNQLLHCCGNMTQYIITGLGNRPDNRRRNDEFIEYNNSNRGGYMELWKNLIDKLEGKDVNLVVIDYSRELVEELNNSQSEGLSIKSKEVIDKVKNLFNYLEQMSDIYFKTPKYTSMNKPLNFIKEVLEHMTQNVLCY